MRATGDRGLVGGVWGGEGGSEGDGWAGALLWGTASCLDILPGTYHIFALSLPHCSVFYITYNNVD